MQIRRDFLDGDLAVPLYDYTARKSRGNPRNGKAEIPREVKFLATAREFRGNGNVNPVALSSVGWVLGY
jgi:hypothetical protein